MKDQFSSITFAAAKAYTDAHGGGAPDYNFSFTSTGLFQYPEEIIIPDNVVTLTGNSAAAFLNHSEIKKISFSENCQVTEITDNAFSGCSGLEYIELPHLLMGIRSFAFAGCSKLKTMIFKKEPTSIDYPSASSANPFGALTALENIQLTPDWTLSMYVATSQGAGFGTRLLTHDCLINMIDCLHDFSGGDAHTLSVGGYNTARLSADEIAVATAKNWSLG